MINAFVSGAVTIQFATPPLREGGESPEIYQVEGRDSLGTQYVYDKSAIVRISRRLVFPRESGANLSALLSFAADTVRGGKIPFTWYDHEATLRTVRLAGEINHRQTGPDSYRVEIPFEEDSAWSAPIASLGKDATAGAAPAWILRLTVAGVDYWLSDMTITVPVWQGGITTTPWVAEWGRVQEGISNSLDEFRVADFSLACLIDPAASPNIETLATGYPLEKSPVELYLWFRGQDAAVSPPEMKFRGYVRDVEIPDSTAVSLVIEDETVRLRNYIGTKVDRSLYPSADPDDVGKVIPIPYGTVRRLPGLAVDAGAQTSLPVAIDAIATSCALSDATYLAPGKVIQVDDEQMLIGTVTGDTVTVTRGHNATIATPHQKGAAVWECKIEFAYLVADTPVDTVHKVFGRLGDTEIDITAVCARYTGQPGNTHASYPGKAVVTIPGLITVSQAVSLLVSSGLSLNDAISVVDGISIDDQIAVSDTIGIVDTVAVSDTIDVSDTISVSQGSHGHNGASYTDTLYLNTSSVLKGSWPVSPAYAVDSNPNTNAVAGVFPAQAKLWRTSSFSRAETPTQIRLVVVAGDPTNSGSGVAYMYVNGSSAYLWGLGFGGTTKETSYGAWVPLSSWSHINAANTYVEIQNSSINKNTAIWEVYFEVQSNNALNMAPATGVAKIGGATKIGAAAKSGAVSKSGGISKLGTVGKVGTVAKSGTVSLSGAVSLSGNSVANTLVGDTILCDVVRSITTPGAVVANILSTYCGITQFQQDGVFPGVYAINGAITEYRPALEWLNTIAFQCRAWFRMELGTAKLIVRPDTLTPIKTIPACRITSDGRRIHRRRKVAYGDILNRVHVLFDRDWAKPRGEDAYRAISKAEDPASIADFGVCERPDLFMFDFVLDADMAASVRDYYLTRYKGRPWLHEFETFLDHSELTFGSVIALGFAAEIAGEILETGHAPGNSTQIDTVKFTVLT